MVISQNRRKSDPANSPFNAWQGDNGLRLELKQNDMLSFAINGIHHDERYFPNPDQFNPDHFSKEAKSLRSP
jgi:hypothetical protein